MVFSCVERKSHCLELTGGGWELLRSRLVLLQPLVQSRGELGGIYCLWGL